MGAAHISQTRAQCRALSWTPALWRVGRSRGASGPGAARSELAGSTYWCFHRTVFVRLL